MKGNKMYGLLLLIIFLFIMTINGEGEELFPRGNEEKLYLDDIIGQSFSDLNVSLEKIRAKIKENQPTDIERWNIDILNRYCDVIRKFIPNEVLFVMEYDAQYSIYYLKGKAEGDDKYFLYISKKGLNDINEIVKSSIFKAIVDDEGYPISQKRITITDFDKELDYNQGNEIIIHLYGPSDDFSDLVIGKDKSGYFRRYFHIYGGRRNLSPIEIGPIENREDNKKVFGMLTYSVWMGHFYKEERYIFDSEYKTVHRVKDIEFPIKPYFTQVIRDVDIFDDLTDLKIGNNKGKKWTLKKGQFIIVVSAAIYKNKWFLQVQDKDISGWIELFDAHKSIYISGAD